VKGIEFKIDEYILVNIVEFKLEGEFVSYRLENFNNFFIYLDCLGYLASVQGTSFKHFKTGGTKMNERFISFFIA